MMVTVPRRDSGEVRVCARVCARVSTVVGF